MRIVGVGFLIIILTHSHLFFLKDDEKGNDMSNSFLEVCGVRCYEENGVAFLHIEDVARGLGFERTEIKNGVEYKSFRWERVDGFLNDLCFRPQVGEAKNQHDYYIPENIFYRLCMKANNSFAKKFQETVANDVLPKLRKHGVYMTDSVLEQTLQNPDFLINILQEYKKEKAEKEKAIIERDEAIRTKACISSKREATLMVAKREDNKKINRLTCENNELKEQNELLKVSLGESNQWMSSAQLIQNFNLKRVDGKLINTRTLTIMLKKCGCRHKESDFPDKSGFRYAIFFVEDVKKALNIF